MYAAVGLFGPGTVWENQPASTTSDLTLDATTHTVSERSTALPGGVTITQRPTAPAAQNQVWAHPHLHCDITANNAAPDTTTGQYDNRACRGGRVFSFASA